MNHGRTQGHKDNDRKDRGNWRDVIYHTRAQSVIFMHIYRHGFYMHILNLCVVILYLHIFYNCGEELHLQAVVLHLWAVILHFEAGILN